MALEFNMMGDGIRQIRRPVAIGPKVGRRENATKKPSRKYQVRIQLAIAVVMGFLSQFRYTYANVFPHGRSERD
jgi:hypothetical protein